MSVPGRSLRPVDTTENTRQAVGRYITSTEERDWSALGDLLAEEVVYEMPQTGERIRGKPAFLRFNAEYPGDWHLRARRIVADGRYAAAWLDARVGAEPMEACVWFDLSDEGLITRVVDYWPERYEPPAGREHLAERQP